MYLIFPGCFLAASGSNPAEANLPTPACAASSTVPEYHNHARNNTASSSCAVSQQPAVKPQLPHSSQDLIYVNGLAYSILKKIGKGGSSVVYEVYDKARNLRAIKHVDLSEAAEDEARGYLNEIALLKKLQVQSLF